MPKICALEGRRFGRLVALARCGYVMAGSERKAAWECECECGVRVIVPTGALTSGNTKSCGCFKNEVAGERFRTHGASNGGTYNSWRAMKERCSNPNNKRWNRYGGRGVKVCARWDSYEAFEEDMGKRPPGLTLERIRNNDDYEPGNCRWATPKEQAYNTCRSITITYLGAVMPLVDACNAAGLSADSIVVMAGREGKAHQVVFDRRLARASR